MTEGEAHKLLKQRAKQELKRKGFKSKEIFEEHWVDDKKYRIDVVGKNENNSIAYECGNTTADKLKNLAKIFDTVIWTPYISKRSERRRTGDNFEIKLNKKGYGCFPKELRLKWGRRLTILPKLDAGLIFKRGTPLKEVLASLKQHIHKIEHRIE